MKKISIFKRMLILVLVFMLSINSFAAIVADNDGATFITKAEFDSLKNNFQAQINNYNTSIDSKIEGAIASYLAGIKVATEFNVTSEINKLNNVKPITFVKSWTLPTTRVGTHAKLGLNIFEFKNMLQLTEVTNSTTIDYFGTKKIGGVTYYCPVGYGSCKIGLIFGNVGTGSWPSDSLRIGEANTDTSKKNIMYRVYSSVFNGTTYNYTSSDQCWDLCPKAFVAGTSVGGTASYYPIPIGLKDARTADPTTAMNISFSGSSLPDVAGQPFGNQSVTWKHTITGLANTGIIAPQTGSRTESFNIAYVYDCEATKTTDAAIAPNIAYWDYLSGGSVTTDKYYGVHDDDWNTAHTSVHTEGKSYQAYFTVLSAAPSTATTRALQYAEDHPATGAVSTKWEMPPVVCYLKKYNQYTASDNIFYEYSNVEQTPIKYFSGVPLFKSPEDGKVKVTLNFVRTATTYSVNYVINDAPFTNSDSLSGNVKILDAAGNESTSKTIATGGSTTTNQTFYIDAKKDQTYWIKACPSTAGATVGITSDATFTGVKE